MTYCWALFVFVNTDTLLAIGIENVYIGELILGQPDSRF